MANLFETRVLTAEKNVYTGSARSMVAPGVEGYLGILANHAPLVTALTFGVINIEEEGGRKTRFAVSGGVLEVSQNQVLILGDAVEPEGEIDVDRARASLQRAQERLTRKDPEIDLVRAEASLRRALNRLRVSRVE